MSKKLKDELEALKKNLDYSSIKFDVNDAKPNLDIFTSTNDDAIAYHDTNKESILEEKDGLYNHANDIINSIVDDYILDEKYKQIKKIQTKINIQIKTLADLLFLVHNSEKNLIELQTNIVGGDITRETFLLVDTFQKSMLTAIEAKSSYLELCENYWENYVINNNLNSREDELKSNETALGENDTFIANPTILAETFDKIERQKAEERKIQEEKERKNKKEKGE